MIFTTKAEYGVRLLIQLGLPGGGPPVSLKEVADAETPARVPGAIAALPKKAELVPGHARRARRLRARPPRGGDHRGRYRLALEGAIAPMDCFIDDRVSRVLCSHLSDGEHCATKLLWMRVQMGVIKSLQRTTLQELVDFASPTEKTLEIHG